MVSRTFHALMEPFLCQRFENHNNVLITQCFTILERPELAKCVKQLDLDLRYVGDSTLSFITKHSTLWI